MEGVRNNIGDGNDTLIQGNAWVPSLSAFKVSSI